MKKCAHCKTENREEAIFCARCRRPLGPVPPPNTSRKFILWLLGIFTLIGLSYFLFSYRSFLLPVSTQTPLLEETPMIGPQPTRTLEPDTVSTCIQDASVHIRRGPGTQYETTGGLGYGVCLTILGRNQDASWVYMVSEDHQTGWVAASVVEHAGDLSRVSIRDYGILMGSARPTLTSAEIAHGAQAYLTQVAATNLPQLRFSKYVSLCFETADWIGDRVSCKMEKAYCDYLPALEGSPTFCSDRPHPDHTFTLIVFGEDWSELDGQCILVEGYLKIVGGALQVHALDRDQVSPCD